MKRHFRRLLNFCSFTLLACSVYLNFIHKEASGVAGLSESYKCAPGTTVNEEGQPKSFVTKAQAHTVIIHK